MPQYLIRHAKAGSRHDFDGPDRDRPLTAPGRLQAAAIADHLNRQPIVRLVSSPYVRCRQTIEPLASQLGLPVEEAGALAEGGSFTAVVDLLASLPDQVVLCSHGDVIPEVIAALERRGTVIDGDPDWRKGAMWIIERDGDKLARAHAVAPPG